MSVCNWEGVLDQIEKNKPEMVNPRMMDVEL